MSPAKRYAVKGIFCELADDNTPIDVDSRQCVVYLAEDYDTLVLQFAKAAVRISCLERALRLISAMGHEHPDPYVEGSWFAQIADAALEPSVGQDL